VQECSENAYDAWGKKAAINTVTSAMSLAFSGFSAVGTAAGAGAGAAGSAAAGAGAGAAEAAVNTAGSAATQTIGQTMLHSGVSGVVQQGLSSGITNSVVSGLANAGAQAVMAGGQAALSGTITSALNAVYWDRDNGGVGWRRDVFDAGLKEGLISAAGGMINGLTSGALNALNMYDGTGLELIGTVFNTDDIQRFNGLAGGLAEQGFIYGMDGEFTLNVANAGAIFNMVASAAGWSGGSDPRGRQAFADISNALNGVGLFEIGFGHDGDITGRIGMGGVDVSPGTLLSSFEGLVSTARIGGAKVASLFGATDAISTINGINYLGHTSSIENQLLGKAIWEREKRVEYGELGEGILGTHEGSDLIRLSSLLLGTDKESAGQIASMLSHENTHILGGDEFASRVIGYETYAELSRMFGLTGAGYESVTDIARMTAVYQEYGELGLFTALASTSIFDMKGDYYIVTPDDPGWKQSDLPRNGGGLGKAETAVKELNEKAALKKAYEEYSQNKDEGLMSREEYEKSLSEEQKAALVAALPETERVTMETLRLYGCTLSTAAYIAYTLGGKPYSLEEANNLLKQRDDIFVKGDQKNEFVIWGDGSSYTKAINILAGAEVVKWVESSGVNDKAVITNLLQKYERNQAGYFVHVQVPSASGGVHSVLAKDMVYNLVYGSAVGNTTTLTGVNVLNPWNDERNSLTAKVSYSVGEIIRADFFEVTAKGRELHYNKSMLKSIRERHYTGKYPLEWFPY
jgi:hypothetical protein